MVNRSYDKHGSGLPTLKSAICSMGRYREHGRAKPHKPLMLLAVIDLIDEGFVSADRIYFDDRLEARFKAYFNAVAKEGDWCQPSIPFFWLKSSCFWSHRPLPGREADYADLKRIGGGKKRIHDNIDYAYFKGNASELISNEVCRSAIRRCILQHFFSASDQRTLDRIRETCRKNLNDHLRI